MIIFLRTPQFSNCSFWIMSFYGCSDNEIDVRWWWCCCYVGWWCWWVCTFRQSKQDTAVCMEPILFQGTKTCRRHYDVILWYKMHEVYACCDVDLRPKTNNANSDTLTLSLSFENDRFDEEKNHTRVSPYIPPVFSPFSHSLFSLTLSRIITACGRVRFS